MKRYAMMAGAAILAAACGSNSPAAPAPPPTTIIFTAALSAANEIPAIANADANARGTATVTMNLTRDAGGAITAAKTTFVYSLSAFPAGTQVTLSHIHLGAPTVSGGVVWNTGLTAADAVTLADGTLTNKTFANTDGPGGAAAATLAQQIIDNPNGYYFNVHTGLNPGGAVRGQLVRQP